MVRCEGKKGAAVHEYNKKMKKTEQILGKMQYVDNRIIAAVLAGGRCYTINGCRGMQPLPEYVRIIGKDKDRYKVVLGNSKEVVDVSIKELLTKLNGDFGVKCSEHEKSNKTREEDR